MQTYIVVTVIANGNPDHPPQVDMWAVRTTSREDAESIIRSKITAIPLLAITSRHLDDGGANVLGLADGFVKTL